MLRWMRVCVRACFLEADDAAGVLAGDRLPRDAAVRLLVDDLRLPFGLLAGDRGRPVEKRVVELLHLVDALHEARELLELRPLVVGGRDRDTATSISCSTVFALARAAVAEAGLAELDASTRPFSRLANRRDSRATSPSPETDRARRSARLWRRFVSIRFRASRSCATISSTSARSTGSVPSRLAVPTTPTCRWARCRAARPASTRGDQALAQFLILDELLAERRDGAVSRH